MGVPGSSRLGIPTFETWYNGGTLLRDLGHWPLRLSTPATWDLAHRLLGLRIMKYRALGLGTLAFTTWHSDPWDLLGAQPFGGLTGLGTLAFGTWDSWGTGLWDLAHRPLGLGILDFNFWLLQHPTHKFYNFPYLFTIKWTLSDLGFGTWRLVVILASLSSRFPQYKPPPCPLDSPNTNRPLVLSIPPIQTEFLQQVQIF